MRELKKRNRLLEQENEILCRAAADLARDLNQRLISRWSRILPPTVFPSR